MSDRIKAIVEYDGTDFCGWQRQAGPVSIQECIESALEKLFQSKIQVTAAGRTDAGAHALGQVISFINPSAIPLYKILKGANTHLPESIRIVEIEKVPASFNPRGDTILRWYRYCVINRSPAPVWARRFVTHIPYTLDLEILREAMSLFLGTKNFAAFRSIDCEAKRTDLTLKKFQLTRRGALLMFDFECRSFLQNMVRILMGAVMEAARGKIPLSLIGEMLETGKRNPVIPTLPASGLTLMRVYYPGDDPEVDTTEMQFVYPISKS
jgi:tRNA pseudouridine38-40 synthase